MRIEDGLLGICDRECRLCCAVTVWNRRDPILKERLFGLDAHEGNHGEDVKEEYWYEEATPTASWARATYRYPLDAYPYETLVRENARRGLEDPEFELLDTGIFDQGRFVDVSLEVAKADDNDCCLLYRVHNHAAEEAILDLLPTLWFRNTWDWGCSHEACVERPCIREEGPGHLRTRHERLEDFLLLVGEDPVGERPDLLWTDNHTNTGRCFGTDDGRFHTDAIQRHLVDAPMPPDPLGADFDRIHAARRSEHEAFYDTVISDSASAEDRLIMRQAYAGMIWTKQFYHLVVADWLDGDPEQPAPPPGRRNGRWRHLYARDVLSMPDTWEYPWFATWDLAFHALPFARIDPHFAKRQLIRLLREWYMHPDGQLPAYEWNFDDVNPPVHAWACLRVYQIDGGTDRAFLAACFHRLLMNFTWWVNRKDPDGNNLFAGGFLGLDNIGLFDRSKPLPDDQVLEQADGTAWMAFYCLTMLAIALELARSDGIYEDLAAKFLKHYVAIADAVNDMAGGGLWEGRIGWYLDHLRRPDGSGGVRHEPLPIRSLVGLVPFCAVYRLDADLVRRLPEFSRRLRWFLTYRPHIAHHLGFDPPDSADPVGEADQWLLAVPGRDRLTRILQHLFNEEGMLSPWGIRSLSRFHRDQPVRMELAGQVDEVRYAPGDAPTRLFGGNSNWRGPVWFPLN
ncbi:MAG: MGH1-like glycoside hydrolase domain-containing protein [Planctomycetota bacterium]